MFRNTKALPTASTERAARAGQTLGQMLMTAAMASRATTGQAMDILIKILSREAENALALGRSSSGSSLPDHNRFFHLAEQLANRTRAVRHK